MHEDPKRTVVKGLGKSDEPEEKKESKETSNPHPGWNSFSAHFKPAADTNETREYLTTLQFLEKLNKIVYDKYYSEEDLFKFLIDSGYKTATIEGVETILWMVLPA